MCLCVSVCVCGGGEGGGYPVTTLVMTPLPCGLPSFQSPSYTSPPDQPAHISHHMSVECVCVCVCVCAVIVCYDSVIKCACACEYILCVCCTTWKLQHTSPVSQPLSPGTFDKQHTQ